MRKINKLGRRAAALVLAVGLTLSTAAPVLAADADEVQTPAAQTQQQETDTEADEADVDTEADEAAALPELSEDREVAEEDEAAALPELDEDWAVDEAALLKGHKHKWKKEKTVAPTCTEQGYTVYKCEYNIFGIGCTETKKADFVSALGHDMSDWIVVKATCTTAGEKYKVCQRSGCNHKVVEEGYAEAHPALGHDFEGAEWVIEAPTCTTPGQRYQVCKRDGCNQKNIADLKSSLNDSFLSQDTITNMVDKLAGDVQDSSAPQAGIKQILHNTVYDVIYNLGVSDDKKKTTDNTQAISDMVLQLVKEVVQSDKGWNDLTGSLVDDAVDLAVDELMKDKTYAKLLKTKLGAATMEEVRAEVKKQLVEDPEFMNQVRGIASKAVDNAQKGVNAGWSNEKIMNRLQSDLLPDVTDLISNQVNKLGASAGDIVDNKVSDTVHKFLPGKLGDWVSDKIGGKVNDAVTGKVDDLNKQVTDLIGSTIKQLTCTHEWGDRETLKAATCTEKGQTGVVCHKCGKVKDQQPIPVAGHAPVTDPAVAPTETTDGLTEGSHCGVCGVVLQAQEVIPMLDPTIDPWFSRAATTEADAKAAGFDSVDAANAALDAALTAAGFDPANAEHFTVQVNSSIGVLPNDRYPEDGVTCKLTLPQATKGQMAQEYYLVQMCTADGRFRKAGDIIVTPVRMDTYDKNGLKFTAYSQSIVALAWKPLY